MSASLAPNIKPQYFDSNGDPLSGGKVYTYQAGTTTPQVTYTDATAGTPNTNPVILDSSGEANIWLDQSLSYKFVIKSSADVTLKTIDGIVGVLTDNAVGTNSIQDSAVTSAKIASGTIARSNLAAGAIARTSQTNVKTTNYTATTSDDTIRCDVSAGSFTLTLPTAVGIQGRRYKIIQTGAISANYLTIDANASETINGALTRNLASQYEMVELESDGTNWIVTNRFIPSSWTNLGACTITGTTSNPTKGTMAADNLWVKREGDSARFRLEQRWTSAGSAGSGDYLWNMPSAYPIDTAKVTAYTTVTGANTVFLSSNSIGSALAGNTPQVLNLIGSVIAYDASKVRIAGVYGLTSSSTNNNGYIGSALSGFDQTAGFFTAEFVLPIANWEG